MRKTWARRLDPASKAVHVSVNLRGPTGLTTDTLFILDIGTPVAIVNRVLAADLGLGEDRSEGPSRLWGPTGPDNGYRVHLPSLTLMDRMLESQQVRCHRLSPEAGINGLIGLDILRMGRFTLDLPWGLVEFRWN